MACCTGILYLNAKFIGNVTAFNLNIKKEKPMKKRNMKKLIEVQKERLHTLKQAIEIKDGVIKQCHNEAFNAEGRYNRAQLLLNEREFEIVQLKNLLMDRNKEIENLNRIAEKNLENFKTLNEHYQKAIDFIGSITDDMKVNIAFKSS